MIFYHGTKKENVDVILRSGLKSGYGWGADRPGVFLSRDPETALYWAEIKAKEDGGSPAILSVDIPEESMRNMVPRKTSFAQEGDMQYLGEIPREWISTTSVQEQLIRKLVRESLKTFIEKT